MNEDYSRLDQRELNYNFGQKKWSRDQKTGKYRKTDVYLQSMYFTEVPGEGHENEAEAILVGFMAENFLEPDEWCQYSGCSVKPTWDKWKEGHIQEHHCEASADTKTKTECSQS